MKLSPVRRLMVLLLGFWLMAAGCRQAPTEERPSPLQPTPTIGAAPTPAALLTPARADEMDFITVATDAPNPPFADFNLLTMDSFGNLVGFDADVLAAVASQLDWEYEFVVTGFDGMLESVASGEFDIAISALAVETMPVVNGIAHTEPYLVVGQVLVVRANDRDLQSYRSIRPGVPIGVLSGAAGEAIARQQLGLADNDVRPFRSVPELLQALIDGVVDGAIVDSENAFRYTNTYWQQLKIAGGNGRNAWITQRSYVMAVAEGNQALLDMLNQAIAETESQRQTLRDQWLISSAPIDAGESLIGTPADQIVIGVVRQPVILNPTSNAPDLLNWELLVNTMSGLMRLDTDNNLVPLLAEGLPVIDESGLEYLFTLRDGLTFPDGRPLTADDVKWSVDRGAANGLSIINGILKDENGDGFADSDAVTAVDPRTVRFVLQEPTVYFLDLLATPPYFVLNQQCFLTTSSPLRNCAGLGQYVISNWVENETIDLDANPQWPGPAPQFSKIQLRMYDNTADMRASLENSAIDIAWTGLTENDLSELQADPGFAYWVGPVSFKSYLIFEQSQPPWDDKRVRQAAAYAVDRAALAAVFDGQRLPLFSPVPDSSPLHVPAEPARDLERARQLLTQAGFSSSRPLAVELWYISDGRYSSREEAYANTIKRQLDETGIFQVTLRSAPWDVYRPQMSRCEYPTFLLGWPSPGQPPRSADPSSWINYFVTNTSTICSNYESEAMDELMAEAQAADPLDPAAVQAAYIAIQTLWADEYPALDLTQAPRIAVALSNVNDVTMAIDAMGLMHYGRLSKGGE